MEASSSSNHNQPPATPSHSSLLPSLSPSGALEQTPAPLHTLPAHLHSQQPPPPQPRLGPAQQQQQSMQPPPPTTSSSSNGQSQHLTPAQQLQQQHQNVFGNVMGQGPNGSPQPGGTAQAKVYASVYSGIPVFEAMIRGISVMRRTSDSWVNATQILKVAGIHKSARTKILEKEIHPGVHEKVQGGYGKYQGTWIPFERGQELAAQYGVSSYLAPVFDFVPSPTAIAALPVIRTGTPDRAGQKTPSSSMAGYTPSLMSGNRGGSSANGRVISPFPHGHGHPHAQAGQLPPPPPPQFTPSNGDQSQMMGMPMGHPGQQPHQMMYYPAPQQHIYPGQGDNKRGIAMAMTPSLSGDGHHNPSLGPAADINNLGLPPSGAEMYIDQYGQPHPTPSYQPISYTTDTDMGPPPAKRQKSEDGAYLNGNMEEQQHEPPQQEGEGEDVDDGASDSSDDLRDPQSLPSSMRLSNKPVRPRPNSNTSKTRSRLLSLFSTSANDEGEDDVNVRQVFGLGPDESPDTFDIDMVIDNQGHTALHWACALSKLSIIKQLIELGSDIHRGNFAGETPLIRSVLTTNQFESGQFYQLLELLSPSIKTLDHSYRSVVHHISMVAGVKGRAASARSYMANVLEWVAREQQQQQITHSMNGDHLNGSSLASDTISLKTLIDIQDVHGDTAINIAARVGNKGLVNLLLDAGADKGKANKLGLKPSDFGLDIESLKVSPAEAIVSSLKSEVPKPERKSRDVQKNIAAIFETISSTFSTEMVDKQTKLNATEQSVRVATKALADKRQQLHRAQVKVGELELLNQRIDSLKQILEKDSVSTSEDWTGRKLLTGENELPLTFRPIQSTDQQQVKDQVENENVEDDQDDDEIKLPERIQFDSTGGTNTNTDSLIKLRRINLWQDRILSLLNDNIQNLENQNFEKNFRYRKLISLSTKVPVDKVDGMLDGLVTAIESDGQSIDLSKISEFMSRMKDTQNQSPTQA
ncbi:hypothetical protein I203_107570 [Kwoniella mangroviensis CBS 8507]|uniref:hypothetical protein n=1 Tax=Kwoniella mangroviensis CBS 8507 TaxID=1296122 RepID=UPI00080CFB9C|nr:uncharacterized protein I203_02320 [Kwoniella mangroviensis CBS 8507]OCF68926.1 hypothetical protein I203_02320 [Kwoniella mangroviensis CBS 8507]